MSRGQFFPLSSRGGPYPPTTAGLGGLPTISLDVPVCSVFIFIYLSFAITNLVIFRLNSRRNHKFIISALLVGFSMSRVVTLVLRIVWATKPHNLSLAIAAQILVNAGILLVFIVNLILAQRILRAMQPHIGWNPALRVAYKILYTSLGCALATVITAVVLSLYTLSTHTKSSCRSILLTAQTYILIFTILPLLHILPSILLGAHPNKERFGSGSTHSKILILTLSTLLCILISGFKAGANWSPPRRVTHPAWYDSKACFYIFNFTCEVCLLTLLTHSRIDRRFWVPDGCKGPGDYTRLNQRDSEIMEDEEQK